MEKKLKKHVVAAVAGTMLAGAVLQGSAHDGQVTQITASMVKDIVRPSENEPALTMQVSYNNSMEISVSENNRLMAYTMHKMLYPFLYEQQFGLDIAMALQSVQNGNFRNAGQALDAVSEKARMESNTLAMKEVELTYNYMRIVEVAPLPGASTEIDRRSTEGISAIFIEKSRRVYDAYNNTALYQARMEPDRVWGDVKPWLEMLGLIGIPLGILYSPIGISYLITYLRTGSFDTPRSSDHSPSYSAPKEQLNESERKMQKRRF